MQHLSGIDRARTALEKGERLPIGALQPVVARQLAALPRWRSRSARRAATQRRGLFRCPTAARGCRIHAPSGARRNAASAFADRRIELHDRARRCRRHRARHDQRPGFADSAAGRSIIPGSIWNESERGTNALGLAAMTGKPVAIYGTRALFRLSWPSELHGGADLQFARRIFSACSTHPAPMRRGRSTRMRSCAWRRPKSRTASIFQELSGNFVFAFHPRVEYLDTLSAGLISVSPAGDITSINRSGRALLAGLPATLGSHFDALFESGFGTAMDGLLSGGVIRIRDRAGSSVFMVCRQIAQGRGSPPHQAVSPPPGPIA